MTPFALQLSTSLLEDDTDANRREWAQLMIGNRIPLDELLELVLAERKLAMRFLWMVGGICDLEPGIVAPHISYFFEKRHTVAVPNYDRSLAKFCYRAGIPEDMEGEISTALFNWLLDPGISVSTKSYAMAALYSLAQKHPALQQELKLVIEDQLDKNTVSFRKQAEKMLQRLS